MFSREADFGLASLRPPPAAPRMRRKLRKRAAHLDSDRTSAAAAQSALPLRVDDAQLRRGGLSASLRVIVRPAARAASSSAPPLDSPMLSGPPTRSRAWSRRFRSRSQPQRAASRPPSARAPTSLKPTKPRCRPTARVAAAGAARARRAAAAAAAYHAHRDGRRRLLARDAAVARSIPAARALDGSVLAFGGAPELHDAGIIDLVLRSADNGRTWPGADHRRRRGARWRAARRRATRRRATTPRPDDPPAPLLQPPARCRVADPRRWEGHAPRVGDVVEGRRPRVVGAARDHARRQAPRLDVVRDAARRRRPARSGRSVPCNHAEDVAEPDHPYSVAQRRSRMVAHAVYSDDHGATCASAASAQITPTRRRSPSSPTAGDAQRARLVGHRAPRQPLDRRRRELGRRPLRRDARRAGAAGARLASAWCAGGRRGRPPRREDEALAPGGGGVLFFCNPASAERREMLTVRRSDDGGATWGASLVVEEGPSAYSALQLLANGRLGVLYERADASRSRRSRRTPTARSAPSREGRPCEPPAYVREVVGYRASPPANSAPHTARARARRGARAVPPPPTRAPEPIAAAAVDRRRAHDARRHPRAAVGGAHLHGDAARRREARRRRRPPALEAAALKHLRWRAVAVASPPAAARRRRAR